MMGYYRDDTPLMELILDDAAHHVDLTPFAPGRLRALDPARLRQA